MVFLKSRNFHLLLGESSRGRLQLFLVSHDFHIVLLRESGLARIQLFP
jgi:hypothetical protein